MPNLPRNHLVLNFSFHKCGQEPENKEKLSEQTKEVDQQPYIKAAVIYSSENPATLI